MGSGAGRTGAQHPLRLLEGWGQEVYVALVSGRSFPCAHGCRSADSVETGVAFLDLSGPYRVLLFGPVPWREAVPVVEGKEKREAGGLLNRMIQGTGGASEAICLARPANQ